MMFTRKVTANVVCRRLSTCCSSLKAKESWAELRRKKWSTDYALENFDDSYEPMFGERWPSIRLALLCQQKYCAVVNNFGNFDEAVDKLTQLGAENIKQDFDRHLRDAIYSDDNDRTDRSTETVEAGDQLRTESHQLLSEDQDSAKVLDEDDKLRFFSQKIAVASMRFNEFVPATKLKGLDDYVNEADFVANYKPERSMVNFQTVIVKPQQLPQQWKIFTFKRGGVSGFPSPRRNHLGVLDYYLMDATSLLPVVALNVQEGDCILDMCAAPGGKTLAMLQTSQMCRLTCNDLSPSRIGRLRNVLKSYIPQDEDVYSRINVVIGDGSKYDNQTGLYNKILVDVPCTVDRHSANENDNNLFHPIRMKERIRLPELQISLLCAALKAVKCGGSVVYSTCTLSPIQNDGVVYMALKQFWETTSESFVVHDLSKLFQPFSSLFQFHTNLKYGQLVVPTLPQNFGPMYVCKISKV